MTSPLKAALLVATSALSGFGSPRAEYVRQHNKQQLEHEHAVKKKQKVRDQIRERKAARRK